MIDAILERLTSPVFWAFVFGVIATLFIIKTAETLIEIKAHLKAIIENQSDIVRHLCSISESTDTTSFHAEEIKDVARSYDKYVLPDRESRDAIDQIRSEAP